MNNVTPLGFFPTWGLVIVGVLISVVLPIMVAAIKKNFPNRGPFGIESTTTLWQVAKPYLLLGAFSIVVGAVIALYLPQPTVQLAVLAGFSWDKTLQTIRDGGTNPAKR